MFYGWRTVVFEKMHLEFSRHHILMALSTYTISPNDKPYQELHELTQ